MTGPIHWCCTDADDPCSNGSGRRTSGSCCGSVPCCHGRGARRPWCNRCGAVPVGSGSQGLRGCHCASTSQPTGCSDCAARSRRSSACCCGLDAAQQCWDQQPAPHQPSCPSTPATLAARHHTRGAGRRMLLSSTTAVLIAAHLAAAAATALLPCNAPLTQHRDSSCSGSVSRPQQLQQQRRPSLESSAAAAIDSGGGASTAAVSAGSSHDSSSGTARRLRQNSGAGSPVPSPGPLADTSQATTAGSDVGVAGISYNNPSDLPVPAGFV